MQRKYTIFSLQLLVCLIIAMSGCTSVITKIDRAEANIESCMLGKLENLGNQPLSYFISERGDPTEKSLDVLDSCSTPYQYSWEDWLGSFHNKRMTACHFDHWPSDYIVFYVDINYVDNIGGDTTDGGSAWVSIGTKPSSSWTWSEVNRHCSWATVRNDSHTPLFSKETVDVLMDAGRASMLDYQKPVEGSNESNVPLSGNPSQGAGMPAGCNSYDGPDDEGWIQLDSLCKRAWIAQCAIDNGNLRERESLQRSCAMYNSMRSSQGIENRVCPYCR